MPNHIDRIEGKSLKIEDLGHEVMFNLRDFMGDPARVQTVMKARGIELSIAQVQAVKKVFAEGKIINPIGPVAGVYESCGPSSKTKVCF